MEKKIAIAVEDAILLHLISVYPLSHYLPAFLEYISPIHMFTSLPFAPSHLCFLSFCPSLC